MANLSTALKGIPAILLANTIDLMVFAAVSYQKTQSPDATVKETIKSVAEHFGLLEASSVEALEQGYYRTLNAYLNKKK
jgi:hypothetical protein